MEQLGIRWDYKLTVDLRQKIGTTIWIPPATVQVTFHHMEKEVGGILAATMHVSQKHSVITIQCTKSTGQLPSGTMYMKTITI